MVEVGFKIRETPGLRLAGRDHAGTVPFRAVKKLKIMRLAFYESSRHPRIHAFGLAIGSPLPNLRPGLHISRIKAFIYELAEGALQSSAHAAVRVMASRW